MQIGQLARLTGLPASTLRFYEQKGLLQPHGRSEGGYRQYDESAVARIQMIQFGQSLGFKLDELVSLMQDNQDWQHDTLLARLDEKLDDAQNLITQLKQKRRQLMNLRQTLVSHWDAGECLSTEQLQDLIGDA
ncbi:putative HTH-type transcriptional regulator [Saliniradius amylolyticus]|uniref:Putative HTH-type transcriptional regulator n=1 Tax=Saliniradius amylolyticus TaxID=2183582 RepID=A0A2S2E214_9ALTE|nr:MerR family transcriptional regulator [Saliniradius amylolyticus]AWL11562.1 putative HTH-type transcriptional regulator [Saliniradius amylolyticus]